MRYIVAIVLSLFALSSMTLAKVINPGDMISYCIANTVSKTLCTNKCRVGDKCMASCKGLSRQVFMEARGTAAWASTNSKGVNAIHIVEDQHECSWLPQGVKHVAACPKSVKYFKNTMCTDVTTGKSLKPGAKGTI